MSVKLKACAIFPFFELNCYYSNLPNCRVGTKCYTVVKVTTENIQCYDLVDRDQKRVLKTPVIEGTFSALFSHSTVSILY